MGRPRRYANATERQRAHRQQQKAQADAYAQLVLLHEEAAPLHLAQRFDVPLLHKQATADNCSCSRNGKSRTCWIASGRCRRSSPTLGTARWSGVCCSICVGRDAPLVSPSRAAENPGPRLWASARGAKDGRQMCAAPLGAAGAPEHRQGWRSRWPGWPSPPPFNQWARKNRSTRTRAGLTRLNPGLIPALAQGGGLAEDLYEMVHERMSAAVPRPRTNAVQRITPAASCGRRAQGRSGAPVFTPSVTYHVLSEVPAWRGGSVGSIYPDWGILGKRPQLRASDMRQCAGIAPSSGRLSLSLGVISPSLRSLRQRVLVDLSVLHDEDEALGWILDQLDVGDRITVDEQ